MGTLYTMTIESHHRGEWTRIARFELGKAYELATEIDWQPIEERHRDRAAVNPASALGYIYSRCPRCAGDLDGSPGAYVCRDCKETCAVPGRYNGAGQLAPDDEAARALFEARERARADKLEREPWRLGAPDVFYDEDGPTFCGVRDVASVLLVVAELRRDDPSIALLALLATLERLATSPARLRCAWWSE